MISLQGLQTYSFLTVGSDAGFTGQPRFRKEDIYELKPQQNCHCPNFVKELKKK